MGLVVVPVPEQMAQAFDIDLDVVQRSLMLGVQGLEPLHGLLDVSDAHREVEPVENVPHGSARRGADESRQCRITIADDRDRLIFLPALIGQGGADQSRGLLRRAANEREPPGWASLDLDLAGDRLEMPNLIPRHRTDVGTVQGDYDLALCRLLQRGCSLGVGCLELPSDGVEPLRTLTWPAGDAGSNISKIRAPSRNDVRAPTSACMRSSSGVQRPGSNSLTGEKVASSTQGGRRQRQILYRGASTSTVPNRVCSRRCRRSFTGWKVRQSGQTLRQCRYSASCPRTMASCNLASSDFASPRESPTSSAVAANTGRVMLTVSTSPQPVFASSRIVHSMSGSPDRDR